LVADSGLLLALLLLALAPLWPSHQPVSTVEGSADAWQLALPWMAVMLAASSTVVQLLQGEGIDRFLTLLAAILGALLAASQFLAHRDSLILLRQSRLSEKTLADVIARAPVGIARLSTEFKMLAANPSLGVLLRDRPEALAGSAIVKYLPPDVQPQMREKLAALASGEREIVESEVPMVRADGAPAWVQLTSTTVKKPTGQVDYFLAMMQDITERHEAEQTSRATLAELERLNQVKTEFLQTISHEFKTALIGIEGFSELMRDGTDVTTNEVREFARDIHSGAERLSKMVDELLELDHVEKADSPILLGLVDMNTVIRREVEQMKLGSDGLTFTAMLDPNLPGIVGDAAKLSQLANMLLRNAVRYSPDGGQIVVATRTHIGQLEVSVTDQGLGMRADFDNPLFSSDDLYAKNPIRRVVGTGLGLGIARHIVALHGGRIWMDRLDGIGFEAHVTFPLEMTAPIAGAGLQAASGRAS
ncbi:MAG TPA: PAS domain-containing sensor histidine kinase, partial [Candidatus Dormibacteraeota bacterium]|nr:PAS domain-containing sensor histidine kinase [Candidatus Dormibacteraeota bacterium]